jgi:hypothetical protein
MVEKWLREVYDDKILHAFTADLQMKRPDFFSTM